MSLDSCQFDRIQVSHWYLKVLLQSFNLESYHILTTFQFDTAYECHGLSRNAVVANSTLVAFISFL
jgi:hypothetical protein